MINYDAFWARNEDGPLAPWRAKLEPLLQAAFQPEKHGKFNQWFDALNALPELDSSLSRIDQPTLEIAGTTPLDAAGTEALTTLLKQFHPWRKGPMNVHGAFIDTEWRSDWKWQRLESKISSLKDRLVLDVGCGNGYHALRMKGAGAAQVIGIDPTYVFTMQFNVLQKYLQIDDVELLPLKLEQLPPLAVFDSVFSMGVLYHRRSPFDHLMELKNLLRPGGELVLETLVIEGGEREVLVPEGRYAQMRNVWFIPTPEMLVSWLTRCGFSSVNVVDVANTTVEEQRQTEWMTFDSLEKFLDPDDHTLSIEGHPAPRRAVLVATKN